jgi:DNA repair exonuclease SbcCD ATPase subunit
VTFSLLPIVRPTTLTINSFLKMATPSPSKSANSGSRKLAQVPGNLTPLPNSLTAQLSRSRAPSGSESVISRAGDNMLRRRVMELECEVRQIKSHHQIDKEVMNDKIRMLEEQIAEYEEMIEEQEAALAQDPTESEAYKIMSSSLEGKIRELLVSNKEANNKIHELEALIGRGKAAELKNAELVKEKKDLESQITKIKGFHRQDMSHASEEVQAVKGRLTETRDECEALRGQVKVSGRTF